MAGLRPGFLGDAEEPKLSTPPPLPLHVRTAAERTILIVAASAAAVAVLLFLVAGFFRPMAVICGWKKVTGWPCAGCGGTRALFCLAGGDWLEALCMNPGVVVGGVGLAVAALYAGGVVFLGWAPWRPAWASRVPWRWWLAGAVAANWLYLLAISRP